MARQSRVQPIHLDDVSAFLLAYAKRPAAGLYYLGGDEALSVAKLLRLIAGALGRRLHVVDFSPDSLRRLAWLGQLLGLRADQIARLGTDKGVDLAATLLTFDWQPAPIPSRLIQAVGEVVARSQTKPAIDRNA